MTGKTTDTHLLNGLRFNKLAELTLPICHTLWILWIAAVDLPNLQVLAAFILISILLFGLLNILITQSTRPKPIVLTTGQNVIYLGIVLLFMLLIAGLFISINFKTALFAIPLFFFVLLTAIAKRYFNKIYLLFYAASWAWLTPLAYSAQDKDIETSSWLIFTCLFFWVLNYKNIQLLRKSISNNRLLITALLSAITFGLLILTGIFSGQDAWFFIGLIFVLIIFIYQIALLMQQRIKQVFLFYPWLSVILLLGIISSYHL